MKNVFLYLAYLAFFLGFMLNILLVILIIKKKMLHNSFIEKGNELNVKKLDLIIRVLISLMVLFFLFFFAMAIIS